ncbi:hypothetical protein B566_EDAN017989 [Ephemera danica]|nr:hypothetical protein B566_EDAN017989 [Ephemera danica]
MRLSLPWLLKDNDLEVTVQDQLLTVSVDVEGKPHSLVSGHTSKRLNQDDGTVQCSIQEGRVEIRLLKEVAGEKWEDFIPGDTNGQSAVDPELLEECDAAPADTARLVRLSTDTHAPTHRVSLSAHQWICSARLTPGVPPGLVLRHDVDAIAWQPSVPKKSCWDMTHVNTFNAFGYVQASKENKKFIVCPPDLGYIAICESSQHVYIYHQPSQLGSELRNRNTGKKVESVARQQVVKTPSSLTQLLGAYANSHFLFLLFKNTILTLAIN